MNSSPQILLRKRPKWVSKILIAAAGLLVIVLAWLLFSGRFFIDSRFRESKIIGKTADQIIAVYGSPEFDSRAPNNGAPPDGPVHFTLIYFAGYQTIGIQFDVGKAFKVSWDVK